MTVFSFRRMFLNVGITLAGGLLAWWALHHLLGDERLPWFRERETVREVVLPEGRRLEGVAWRDGDLWVLTRPAGPGEGCSGVHNLARSTGWALVRERFVVREREAPDAGGAGDTP